MSKGAFHIPSLDGLRTVSFAVVFASHAGATWVPGGFGVTVFFFLSGFLITTLLRRELGKTGRVSLRNFYLRRALRILPPFYLILSAAALLSAWRISGGGFEPRALLAQALHYANYWIVWHGFGGLPPGTGVYWSLAVEEHFYLLFPCLFLLLARSRAKLSRQAGILLGLCALGLLWRCYLWFGLGAPVDRLSVSSDTRFDSILVGCALALHENPMLDESRVPEWVWKRVLLPLGVVALLFSFANRNPAFRETLRYSLQGAALIPVFVCAMRYPDWWLMKPLNLRPIAFVGSLSYSLYLLHQVVLGCFHTALPGLGNAAIALGALGVSLVLSFLVYVTIERPCAKLRRRLQA